MYICVVKLNTMKPLQLQRLWAIDYNGYSSFTYLLTTSVSGRITRREPGINYPDTAALLTRRNKLLDHDVGY